MKMGKPNKNYTRKKPKNPPSPRSAAEGGDVKEQPNSKPEANDCRYLKQDPPDIYVNIPKPEKEKKWSWANRIAVGSVVITVVYTLFTWLLYREGRREFKAINQPYLEITADSLKFNDSLKTATLAYHLENLKDFPAQILDKKTLIEYWIIDSSKIRSELDRAERYTLPTGEAGQWIFRTNGINRYVIKGVPVLATQQVVHSELDHSNPHYEDTKHGIKPIDFIIVVKYKDLVSDRIKYYRCFLQLIMANRGEFNIDYRYNENTDD